MSIKDDLPEFKFGLWGECPDVPVAWGARAIYRGVDILHDRQTMAGPEKLKKAFSAALNSGPLKLACEEIRKLQNGFDPIELDDEKLRSHLLKKYKHDASHAMNEGDARRLINQITLFRKLYGHEQAMLAHHEEKFEHDLERGIWTPDRCDECDGESLFDVDDEYIVCDDCGTCHYYHDIWAIDNPRPKTPMHDTFGDALQYVLPRMDQGHGETFVVFDSWEMKILADSCGSFGYINIIAFPNHEKIDDLKWSGKDVPKLGEKIDVRASAIGSCVVVSYINVNGWLHLVVMPDVMPDWIAEKGGGLINVTGAEI